MKPLKVAVALVTHERPVMLREALRSLQKQTRQPDLVLISDNSQQPDRNVVTDFPDLPIEYHFHEKAPSLVEHWLWALAAPEADLVAFLEDDNLFLPRHIEMLARAMEVYPEAAIAGTAVNNFWEQVDSLQREVIAPGWSVDLLNRVPVLMSVETALATCFFGTPFASSAVMIRKSMLPPEGFVRTGFKTNHDRWMWTQVAAQGPTVFVPEVTMLYRNHAAQDIRNFKRRSFREESAKCMLLTWDYMASRGIDPEKAFAQLVQVTSPKIRRWYSCNLFRTRVYKTWYRVARVLRPEITPAKALREAVIDMGGTILLRRWRG